MVLWIPPLVYIRNQRFWWFCSSTPRLYLRPCCGSLHARQHRRANYDREVTRLREEQKQGGARPVPYGACALESCVNLLRRRPHVATSPYIPPYLSSQFDRTPNLLVFPPACCAPLAPPPPWPHVSSSRRGSPAESRASTPPPASRARPPPGGYSCSHMAVPHTRLGSAAPDHTPSMAGSDHS